MQKKEFTNLEINNILNNVVGKTLGEVDTNNVFAKTLTSPKITGIAGDVIEQSVLGYTANSDQGADIIVDGVDVEVKTTGLRNERKRKDALVAKEPMSITAVSPEYIIDEEFETSMFWKKLERTLIVYYHYNSDTTVTASEYRYFPIKGFDLHIFSEQEKEILKNDWTIVRDFIIDINQNYDNPKNEYPRLSSELRSQLMLLDTAPKWPNRPRFRLKRSAVDSLVQKYFSSTKTADIAVEITSLQELDNLLTKLTNKYVGMTVKELVDHFNIQLDNAGVKSEPKNITELISVAMFGSTEKKLKNLDLFNKAGINYKTIKLTPSGNRTEDMKLMMIDFNEIKDTDITFENSSIYNYFSENQFLFAIYEQDSKLDSLLSSKFRGFQRRAFSDEFIYQNVAPVWEKIRHLVINDLLQETVLLTKEGVPQVNDKYNTTRTSLNFPKSKEGSIFVRGSGKDSTYKNTIVNGISMYSQYFWIKGELISSLLREK